MASIEMDHNVEKLIDHDMDELEKALKSAKIEN